MGYVGHKVEDFLIDNEQSNGGTYTEKQYAYYKHKVNSDGSGYIDLHVTNGKNFDGDTFGFLITFLDETKTAISAKDIQWGINGGDERHETMQIVLPPEVARRFRYYSILWYRIDSTPDLGELGIALGVIALALAAGIPFAPASGFTGI